MADCSRCLTSGVGRSRRRGSELSWSEREFVVFDLEAMPTGLIHPLTRSSRSARSSSATGSKSMHSRPWCALLDGLRGFTCKLTGLTDEELASAPMPAAALRHFYRFVGNRPMVAHNGLGYDFPLLDSAGADAGGPRAPRLSGSTPWNWRIWRFPVPARASSATRTAAGHLRAAASTTWPRTCWGSQPGTLTGRWTIAGCSCAFCPRC